jgi:hypothetical protein
MYSRVLRIHFPQDATRAQAVPLHPAARGVTVAVHAAEPFDRIEEPRLAAHRQIEPAVAVGYDVEASRLLSVDDACDGVQILLTE